MRRLFVRSGLPFSSTRFSPIERLSTSHNYDLETMSKPLTALTRRADPAPVFGLKFRKNQWTTSASYENPGHIGQPPQDIAQYDVVTRNGTFGAA